MTTQHINDRLGPGGLSSVAVVSEDTSGNTVLGNTVLVDPSGRVVGLNSNYGAGALPVLQKISSLGLWSKTASDPGNANIVEDQLLPGIGGQGVLRFLTTAAPGKQASVDQNLTFNLATSGGIWVLWQHATRESSTGVGLTMYLSHSVGMASGVGRVSLTGMTGPGLWGRQTTWIGNTDWAPLDGSPNFANDWKSWRLRIDSNPTEPHDFSVAGVLTKGVRPKVLITFDDGWTSSYTIGWVEAQKRNIPLTHYLIGSLLGAANHITTAQALAMRASGDYLGLHGAQIWSVDTQQRILSDIAALQGISDCRHGAWPDGNIGYGTTPAEVIENARACGLRSIRMAGHGANNIAACTWLPGYTDWASLPSFPLNNQGSLAKAKEAVDRAIASGGMVVFYGHKLAAAADSLTWVTDDYTALLDYIAQKRTDGVCDVVTIAELYNGAGGL